ncbi:hypothetical protein PHYPSEUDO_002881 [Phytophthora pseudosyringae]|uniref:Uncharacterized protein n=1 Tax=Phytophthora pseudosyringae TaxID=221518 RepID=A0A8T1VW66_9STRA|nr:hypothetical protein PHYPSEUDO_002881 [Phytophthora pseudosyringae]
METATRAKAKLQNEEFKDAYRLWLKDLHDDKPETLLRKLDNKKKSGGGRRARRNQRTQHAQQHTAASALKDVARKKAEQAKLPALSLVHTPADKQALQDSQNRRHQALVDEANYSAFQYANHPSWRPGLAFFQQLVRQLLQKSPLETGSGNDPPEGVVATELPGFPVLVAPILLRIPIRRHGGSHLGVALLYCQEQTQDQQHVVETNGDTATLVLHCRVYERANSWRNHGDTLLDIVANSSTEICAVRKCAENFESRNNAVQLLRSRQEVETAMDELWAKPGDTSYDTDLLAIQKYIPFKGASSRANAFTSATTLTPSPDRKAWIARCASRKRDKNSSTVWIVAGGDGHDSDDSTSSTAITNSSSADCQLVKCTIDQAWPEPRLLASMCTMPFEKALRVRFNELVVDLLQDTSGSWWLLQVKAFTLASSRPASAASVSAPSSSLSKKTLLGLSRTQSAPTRFEIGDVPTPHWKKWRCAGRYCGAKNSSESVNQQVHMGIDDTDDDKEPRGYLTKKMLRSCEFYDDFVQQQDMSLAGGFTEFHSALAFHLQHRLPKRDRSQLYEPQPLCSACIKRYHSLRQQWMETVEAPKATASAIITAGHRSKNRPAKTHNEHPEQYSLLPRKLPSLHRLSEVSSALNASTSTPVLLNSNFGHYPKPNEQDNSAILSNQTTYLDELAAMDEMLAEHEPPSFLSKTKNGDQSSVQSKVTSSSSLLNALPAKASSHDDTFPNWDGVTRIEEMWQNLTFKPLASQLTDPSSNPSGSGSAKQGYNSISLQRELANVDSMSDTNHENDAHTSPESKVQNEGKQSSGIGRVKPIAAHAVHVNHCRRVFEDELYREGLVNDALSALRSGKANVCFVVSPPNPERERTAENEDELAEMALRSLYIDVKQAVAASSDDFATDLCLSSWPMRPIVCRETSGCVTVKLGLI